jgi:hypothetical protein
MREIGRALRPTILSHMSPISFQMQPIHCPNAEPEATAAQNSGCVYYLRSNEQAFQRASVCVDRRFVRLSDLSRAPAFVPRKASRSTGAGLFRIWPLNPILRFRVSAEERFIDARQFNRSPPLSSSPSFIN